MSDLDLGMNDHISAPLSWDDARRYDRGKVLDAADLEAMQENWGRYLDVDGDGICYRTYPGTHPDKGVYFTRGTSHNEYSAYTEDNVIYARVMQRLLRKWQTARTLMPAPHENIRDPRFPPRRHLFRHHQPCRLRGRRPPRRPGCGDQLPAPAGLPAAAGGDRFHQPA